MRIQLVEVVMDLGRPPVARFPGGDVKLSPQPITEEDLQLAVEKVRTLAITLPSPALNGTHHQSRPGLWWKG